MEWTEDHDLCLSQEIISLEPFKARKGSIARGNIWDQIANNLNSLEIRRYRVSKRSVRERYTLLIEKLKKKLKEEEKASGIETSMSDVEKALEEIMEKESDADNTVESNKKKADHAKAVEMRKRAMESIRSTQKRKGVMKSRMKRMLKQTQRSQGGVVEKQLHIYARKMIWL